MNKEELRIGNLVDCNGQVEIVYAIRNSGVDFYRGKTKKSVIMQSYLWEAIKPIPLTEEWFLKLGFVYKLLGGWRKGKLRLSDNLEVPVYYAHYNGAFLKTIQYVHELQNLYFALTNEELTLDR